MTLLDQMQNTVESIETKKNETTTIKFQDDRKLWELKDELKKAGYKQTANAYWCYIFEKEGHKVILDREDEVVEPVEEVKQEETNLTDLEKQVQVLEEMTYESGWVEYHSKNQENKGPTETFCRFELRGTSEYSYEDTDAELVENDIDIYNSLLIEKLEEKFGDRLEHLEYYRYTISNTTDDEEDILIDMFEKVEDDLEHCYISYDFIDKEE